MTNPAAVKESIGLPGQLFSVKFFAALLINFIMTGQLRIIYRDLQKNSPAPGQAATNHTGWPLAFICRYLLALTEIILLSSALHDKFFYPRLTPDKQTNANSLEICRQIKKKE